MMTKIMEFQKNYEAKLNIDITDRFDTYSDITGDNEKTIDRINIDNIKEGVKYTTRRESGTESYEIEIINKFLGSIEANAYGNYSFGGGDNTDILIKSSRYKMQMVSFIVTTENEYYNVISVKVHRKGWDYDKYDKYTPKYGVTNEIVNRIFIGKYFDCASQSVFQSIMKYFKSGHIEFKDNKLKPLIKFDIKPKYLILPEDMDSYYHPKEDILYMYKNKISTLTDTKIRKWDFDKILRAFMNTYHDDEYIKLRDDFDIVFNIVDDLIKIGFENYKVNKFKLR